MDIVRSTLTEVPLIFHWMNTRGRRHVEGDVINILLVTESRHEWQMCTWDLVDWWGHPSNQGTHYPFLSNRTSRQIDRRMRDSRTSAFELCVLLIAICWCAWERMRCFYPSSYKFNCLLITQRSRGKEFFMKANSINKSNLPKGVWFTWVREWEGAGQTFKACSTLKMFQGHY